MTTDHSVRPRRSFIFAPGLRPEMFPKAIASGTDIVCVELEDGIAPKDKDEARQKGLALFAEPQADDGVERIVRINCLRSAFGLALLSVLLICHRGIGIRAFPYSLVPYTVVSCVSTFALWAVIHLRDSS